MSDLVNLTIDGTPVSVPKGTTLIEAAKQAGVLVPHYCYHPSLQSPAVCRMCLVEVEKNPKLQPSCVTTVAEGQVVHVNSDNAKKAREGVLEFLLINHPLDCPICDQAGECELQDYVFQEGRAGTRYEDYAKRYNPVEDFGPDVLYVANRCILCTRCVRFMDDVAEEPVLCVAERGDRAFIGIDPAHKLTHEWSGNVVDLCPVGSLVSKDFLHKARAWDLDKAAGVCTGCSQGCNITIETRDDAVVRLKPRPNLEVNRHFMCDTGRADYRWMNRGDRVEAPLVRVDGKLAATDWMKGFEALAGLVKGANGPVVVLASGRASVESLALTKKLVAGKSATLAVQVPMSKDAEAPLKGVPNLALRQERAPNGKGAEWLGYSKDWNAALSAAKSAALVLVVGAELSDAEWASLKGGRLAPGPGRCPPDRRGRLQARRRDGAAVRGRGVRGARVHRTFDGRPAGGGRVSALMHDLWHLLMLQLTWLTPEVKGFLLVTVVKLLLVFTVVMVGVAYSTLLERKVSAWMQFRMGPNRAGYGGFGQPIADGIKNIVKEETHPAAANPVIFTIAPMIAFIPALTLSAVIPFAAPIPGFDFTLPFLGRFVQAGPVPMVVADLPVGFLFVLAISSLGVYG
ncbi:MAG: NADH-quinone oxidoreductase subunit H, partial [Gemmatimonadetes bacterium]|nr:NADH-quinone oxidoreductase subunit H [Gemmatimonadota bacterium]